MPTISRFEDLRIWQDSRELVKEIYQLTKMESFKKDYGLSSQMQRAAVSVMANIAEGFERNSNKEFTQYLFQSKGSCGELRSHLYLAMDLEYVSSKDVQILLDRTMNISRGLGAFISYLKGSPIKGKKFLTR